MNKDNTICFQTSSEIKSLLAKIAEKESQSVSSLVETIICHYLKNDKSLEGVFQNRRRYERKEVSIPAYIGDPRWQRHDFVAGTILDISFGGIRMSIPKGTKVEIENAEENDKFSVIFRIPDYHWPVNVKISPRRVIDSEEVVQIGASLTNPDFHAYSALQKYLI
ncbi:MAG: PilZ domain-containing protein [Proteobacteria bacterium]|nr:PilZ domain-containing protein [Pseudomonadota bacterium]